MKDKESGERPLVSIVMPIRNEADYIERSLGCVLAQDYRHDRMEVVIVDGESDDETPTTICRMAGETDVQIRLLNNPARIAPTAMNLGIRAARGAVIVRVDGHCMLPADYVRRCVELLMSRSDVDCVGGAVESVGHGAVGQAIALAMSSTFGVGNSSFRTASENLGPVETDTVPFGAFRREVFDRIGLFNEEMVRHQDYEFNYRLRQSGGRIMLIPSLRATYYVRPSLRALVRQYWQYGIWKGQFLKRYPTSARARHLVPPVFVMTLYASLILTMLSPLGMPILVGIAGAYVLAMVVTTVRLAFTRQVTAAAILPIVFVCLHLSWGTGIWLGLMRRQYDIRTSGVSVARYHEGS